MDGVKMRTGWRRYGGARLYIRKCTALPEHMRDRTRELRSLETHAQSQQQGHATMLMLNTCAEADFNGVVLVLWPSPWGDNIALSAEQLQDWYERRFGFKVIQKEPVAMMARQVGATPLSLNPISEAIHGKR